jgi:hypothetical protein
LCNSPGSPPAAQTTTSCGAAARFTAPSTCASLGSAALEGAVACVTVAFHAAAISVKLSVLSRCGITGGTPEMASEPHRLMSDSGKGARDVAESCAYFGPEIRDGHHADYGDQAHKHTVFDQGRTLVIAAEPID